MSVNKGIPENIPSQLKGEPGLLMRLFADYRVLFLVVGIVNTAVGFGWFVLFELTIGRIWGYMATLLFAHIFSVLCAFALYRYLVFRVRGHFFRDLLRFESVYLVSIGINAVLLPIGVSVLGIQPILAQAMIVLVTTLVSFFGHKYFSFRRKPNPHIFEKGA